MYIECGIIFFLPLLCRLHLFRFSLNGCTSTLDYALFYSLLLLVFVVVVVSNIVKMYLNTCRVTWYFVRLKYGIASYLGKNGRKRFKEQRKRSFHSSLEFSMCWYEKFFVDMFVVHEIGKILVSVFFFLPFTFFCFRSNIVFVVFFLCVGSLNL